MDPQHLLPDEFSTSQTLQQWIRISYDVSDEEGTRILKHSVDEEWRKEIGTLDDIKYVKLFDNALENILNLPLKDLKRWFVEIRTGRLASTTEDIIVD